ncbi:MAG: hypothetical protein A2Z29_00330 [Chloroflexi bacterium RBG_16_56_11]|nr:MAG: hypothetical protein A2Z29_00330 [Chloroflexi bacterium RBG_16_56_11]
MSRSKRVIKYTHLELNRDVPAPAGYYTPTREVRLRYDGRDVLYVVNQTVIDSSCCGVSDFASALVPGFIVKWRSERNKDGNPESVVDPVSDGQDRDKIRKIIRDTEHVRQTEFW